MANVMQLELLPRSASLTAILGAQQRVAANDRTEFSAHAWLTRNWPLGRPQAGRRYTLLAHVADDLSPAISSKNG